MWQTKKSNPLESMTKRFYYNNNFHQADGGLRKRDSYYSNHRVVQSYIWLSISLIIQRNHKRFKWNLVGWLETCEGLHSGTCFTFLLPCVPKINHHLPCDIPENRITPAGPWKDRDGVRNSWNQSRTSVEREWTCAFHVEWGWSIASSPALNVVLQVPTCSPVPTSSVLEENTPSVASSWTSFLSRAQIPAGNRPRLWSQEVTKLSPNYHLLWGIHIVSLSFSFLH